MPARTAAAYLCALVSFGCGIGLVTERGYKLAAYFFLAFLGLWMLAFRVPVIVKAPLDILSWENWGETAAIVAAACALSEKMGAARALYGVTMVVFGTAHFVYLKETASLVPGWLPWHLSWAAFTGAAYIAAGLGILSGILARWAVILSAAQMGGFTLLVWLPIITAAGPKTAFQWSETMISLALTVSGWVIAESCRTSAGAVPRS